MIRKLFCVVTLFPLLLNAQTIVSPIVSQESGFYENEFDVTISHPNLDVRILYTLDGSEPKIENLVGKEWHYKMVYPKNPGDVFGALIADTIWTYEYVMPIHIYDRTNENSRTSQIKTNVENSIGPIGDVFKGFVLKVVAYKDGEYSEEITRNYFVTPEGTNRYSLPVVSLSADNDLFYDYQRGLTVPGALFDEWRNDNPTAEYQLWRSNHEANYFLSGGDTEFKINFSYYQNGTEILNHGAGLRLNGNSTRINPNKSYRLYAKNAYGASNFEHTFFTNSSEDKFKRLILRNGGNDASIALVRDAFIQDLTRSLNFEIQESQPVIVFVNGEYNGLRDLRERYDTKYFEQKYNIDEDDLDYLENDGFNVGVVSEGNDLFFNEMTNFLNNNSLVSDIAYKEAITYLDPINYTDLYITNIFVGNTDWPGNNYEFWRKRVAYDSTAAYGNDGRFRWVLKDTDFGFNLVNSIVAEGTSGNNLNVLNWATKTYPNNELHNNSTLLIRKLLENEDYKIYFINRFADVLNTTLKSERIIDLLDQYKLLLQPEVDENGLRWGGFAPRINNWQDNFDVLYSFADERPMYQRNHIMEKFELDAMHNLTLDVSAESHGYIHLNTIDILPTTDGIDENVYPWTGVYFSNIPVELKAIAKEDYRFSHWSGNFGVDSSATITLILDSNVYIKANFIPNVNAIAGILSAPDTICSNDTFSITTTGWADSGVTIQWESSPSGENDWTIIPSAATMIYTAEGGITENTDFRLVLSYVGANLNLNDTSDIITITVLESIVMENINIVGQEGCTFDFEIENTQGINHFVWSFETGDSITLLPVISYTFSDDQQYQVTVTGYGDCGEKTLYKIVDCTGLSVITDEFDATITIYPNPAANFIHINGLDQLSDVSVLIVNTLGKVVYIEDNINTSDFVIDSGKIENGLYNLVILNDSGVNSFKVQIAK